VLDFPEEGMPQKNSRRTPTQERAQATVDAIVEATAQLLVEDGYSRASTNRIASRAGVSIGSLYHYFADKDALIGAVVERLAERQLANLAASLTAHAELELEPAVRGLVRAALQAQQVDRELSAVLLNQCPGETQRDLDRRWKRRMSELLAARLLSGRRPVRPRAVELAAWVLVHAVFGVVQDALAERPELLQDDALADELTELAVRYLRPD
jgi:AcrR family transcriptional regulator